MAAFLTTRVVTVGELLSGEYLFELPWFQRAYAWNTDEVSRLLTHVWQECERSAGKAPYHLGTLVIGKSADNPMTALIDGQQRVMTLTILFAVLRDMEQDTAHKAQMQSLIAMPRGGRILFVPQEGCADFFSRFVQQSKGTARDFDDGGDPLSDAENHILDNRDRLKERLSGGAFDDSARHRLFHYLKDQCNVVLHIYGGADEGWRWLQREEETQHKFNASDKAKTSLTLAMPAADRVECGAVWDECEAMLGDNELFELIGHVLLLKRRSVSSRPVESELARTFELNRGGKTFAHEYLRPAAQNLAALRNGTIGQGRERDTVTAAVQRASWIDEQNWVPAALLWLDKPRQDAATAVFFKHLERLVWLMRLSGMDGVQKQERILRLLKDIESGSSVEGMKALQIERALRQSARNALRSETFDRKHFCRAVLRLVSIAMGEDPGPIKKGGATVEHIFPKGCKIDPEWATIFPAKSTKANAHRLGNLTLLSKEDNHAVAHRAWSVKRAKFAQSHYLMSRELAGTQQWTPAAITDRTQLLTERLFGYWKLPL